MSTQPSNQHRPDSRMTVITLTAGTIVAVAIFTASFILRFGGQVATADTVSTLAVGVLLATPAAALITTSIELHRPHRSAAVLAVLILLILIGATILALIGR